MSLRFREAWRARKDRRARVNQQLADADAAERWEWVQQGIPEQPTPEQTERILRMIREQEWGAS